MSSKPHEIYLDLDGVCVDFITSALIEHGFEPQKVFARWRVDEPGQVAMHMQTPA